MSSHIDWRSDMENAPRDRLIDILIGGKTRWCDCYYDQIYDQWRTSRPSGHPIGVAAKTATHWMMAPLLPGEMAEMPDMPDTLARAATDGENSNHLGTTQEAPGAAVLAGGETSSIDHQQQKGVAWDIIDEALNAYDTWMQDDDYDAGRCLIKIIQRMKSRQSLYRDDEAGGESDEVMAWNTLIRGAHQWATQHMDQWDKFKFGTRYGPVYVSLVRQTPCPADFVSVSLPGETTPPLATGQAAEGVKKDVPEPASFTSTTVDGVPTPVRYGSGPLGKSATRLSDLELRVVALEKRPAWTEAKEVLLLDLWAIHSATAHNGLQRKYVSDKRDAAFPDPGP